MRIFILAFGTRGDVELFLILGRELARRGHHVRFAAAPFYETRVLAAGLTALPFGQATFAQLQAVLRSLSSLPRQQRADEFFRRWIRPQIPAALERIGPLSGDIDFFICNLKLGLNRDGQTFPGASITYDPPDSLEVLRATRPPKHLGRVVEIVALSKALVDPEALWGEDYHFTGFWDEVSPNWWQPPADLIRFLRAGPPPVVLAMGSMVSFDTRGLAAVLDEALRRIDGRAIVVEGWSSFPRNGDSNGRIHVAKDVPYEWLFDKASCVIHHGGSGTLAAVLRAGKPSILLPQLTCQEHFGKMLIREKLAVDVLDVESLEVDQLARALTRALDDQQIRQSVQAWQTVRCQEKGVTAAADLIETHWRELSDRGPRPSSNHVLPR
jgi:UDP:flavonoid glycosyltransferase YjiC (YdhE family)